MVKQILEQLPERWQGIEEDVPESARYINELVDKERNKNVLNLSKEDSRQLLKDLKNPPKANRYLREAFEDYKKHVKSDI